MGLTKLINLHILASVPEIRRKGAKKKLKWYRNNGVELGKRLKTMLESQKWSSLLPKPGFGNSRMRVSSGSDGDEVDLAVCQVFSIQQLIVIKRQCLFVISSFARNDGINVRWRQK